MNYPYNNQNCNNEEKNSENGSNIYSQNENSGNVGSNQQSLQTPNPSLFQQNLNPNNPLCPPSMFNVNASNQMPAFGSQHQMSNMLMMNQAMLNTMTQMVGTISQMSNTNCQSIQQQNNISNRSSVVNQNSDNNNSHSRRMNVDRNSDNNRHTVQNKDTRQGYRRDVDSRNRGYTSRNDRPRESRYRRDRQNRINDNRRRDIESKNKDSDGYSCDKNGNDDDQNRDNDNRNKHNDSRTRENQSRYKDGDNNDNLSRKRRNEDQNKDNDHIRRYNDRRTNDPKDRRHKSYHYDEDYKNDQPPRSRHSDSSSRDQSHGSASSSYRPKYKTRGEIDAGTVPRSTSTSRSSNATRRRSRERVLRDSTPLQKFNDKYNENDDSSSGSDNKWYYSESSDDEIDVVIENFKEQVKNYGTVISSPADDFFCASIEGRQAMFRQRQLEDEFQRRLIGRAADVRESRASAQLSTSTSCCGGSGDGVDTTISTVTSTATSSSCCSAPTASSCSASVDTPVRLRNLNLNLCRSRGKDSCSAEQDESSSDDDVSLYDSSFSDSSGDDGDDDEEENTRWTRELARKRAHPEKLDDNLWFNEVGKMNDGPACCCSLKARETGLRHNIYPNEHIADTCDLNTNNKSKLYHYRLCVTPETNFKCKKPTTIRYLGKDFTFEGFSIFSHYKFVNIPVCKFVRFSIEYTIHWIQEPIPDNFSIRSLDLFSDYLLNEIIELVDFTIESDKNECRRFHYMPRFTYKKSARCTELLSMNAVLQYLIDSSEPLDDGRLSDRWLDRVERIRGTIVTKPGSRPSSIRADQYDLGENSTIQGHNVDHAVLVHFGTRPVQLSYAGNPVYQRQWKQYVKLRHLLFNKPRIDSEDRDRLRDKQEELSKMKNLNQMKREVTIEITAQGFFSTGLNPDVCQHAFLLPVISSHIRLHKCLTTLEDDIKYKFKNRSILQLALTHPSYRVNFSCNVDHIRNALANCGIRQPEYGDRKIHVANSRKKGIATLVRIMARLGKKIETTSNINHNERLEYLGDAVVESITTIHLFRMFTNINEGVLSTYRSALVQNQHLAALGKKIHLQDYMLYAHGPDLCLDISLRLARANCFEALMGALYLDGGIDCAGRVFADILFRDSSDLLNVWNQLKPHPLQMEEEDGDRHWIESSPVLQKLVNLEDSMGISFNHIRLLAKAMTPRKIGINKLTGGHNQRLEYLGDSILQLVTTVFLFRHFPNHHEGHLSLLRSSLVNNKTLSIICEDLAITNYIITANQNTNTKMRPKERADLVEAYIGALYLDKGFDICMTFASIVFFPRLKELIKLQQWNDPKSQLQQCCLTLRDGQGIDPDVPIYKILKSTGPTNTRIYTVAVYFKGRRLEKGDGHTIQQAEMQAATNALTNKKDLFPQLSFQKNVINQKFPSKY